MYKLKWVSSTNVNYIFRNESAGCKTVALKDEEYTFVKENHMLSRERVTLFTQVSSQSTIKLKTEFVFKGAPESKSKLTF